MTNSEIAKMTATETYNKINVTITSIKKAQEWLKWNTESCIFDSIKVSLNKRKSELVELQNRLDALYQEAI